MLRTRNQYCSNCLATERFLVLVACLVCERCSKRLELSATVRRQSEHAAQSTPTSAIAVQPAMTAVAWAERPAA